MGGRQEESIIRVIYLAQLSSQCYCVSSDLFANKPGHGSLLSCWTIQGKDSEHYAVHVHGKMKSKWMGVKYK